MIQKRCRKRGVLFYKDGGSSFGVRESISRRPRGGGEVSEGLLQQPRQDMMVGVKRREGMEKVEEGKCTMILPISIISPF